MNRKVWVTKYALTEGVVLRPVKSISDCGKYVYVNMHPGDTFETQCRDGIDCFDESCEDLANIRAFAICKAKLKSLAKAKSKVEDAIACSVPR